MHKEVKDLHGMAKGQGWLIVMLPGEEDSAVFHCESHCGHQTPTTKKIKNVNYYD